jgi:guanosine-3',5'-bis(diphosphate) 3'-pyrophosphohydrolase
MHDSLKRLKLTVREVQLVKLADRITNLEPPPAHWTLEKKKGYLLEAKTIAEALGASSAFLLARLNLKMSEYEVYCR